MFIGYSCFRTRGLCIVCDCEAEFACSYMYIPCFDRASLSNLVSMLIELGIYITEYQLWAAASPFFLILP